MLLINPSNAVLDAVDNSRLFIGYKVVMLEIFRIEPNFFVHFR